MKRNNLNSKYDKRKSSWCKNAQRVLLSIFNWAWNVLSSWSKTSRSKWNETILYALLQLRESLTFQFTSEQPLKYHPNNPCVITCFAAASLKASAEMCLHLDREGEDNDHIFLFSLMQLRCSLVSIFHKWVSLAVG